MRIFKLRTLLESPKTTSLVALFPTLRPKNEQRLNKLPSLEDVALGLLNNSLQIAGLEGVSHQFPEWQGTRKQALCLPFDHEQRERTGPRLDAGLLGEVRQIFDGVPAGLVTGEKTVFGADVDLAGTG